MAGNNSPFPTLDTIIPYLYFYDIFKYQNRETEK